MHKQRNTHRHTDTQSHRHRHRHTNKDRHRHRQTDTQAHLRKAIKRRNGHPPEALTHDRSGFPLLDVGIFRGRRQGSFIKAERGWHRRGPRDAVYTTARWRLPGFPFLVAVAVVVAMREGGRVNNYLLVVSTLFFVLFPLSFCRSLFAAIVFFACIFCRFFCSWLSCWQSAVSVACFYQCKWDSQQTVHRRDV